MINNLLFGEKKENYSQKNCLAHTFKEKKCTFLVGFSKTSAFFGCKDEIRNLRCCFTKNSQFKLVDSMLKLSFWSPQAPLKGLKQVYLICSNHL